MAGVRRTTTPRGQATRLATERSAQRALSEQMFLTRASSRDTKGGLLIPVRLAQSGRMVLIRRLSMMERMRHGAWPKPLTSMVRKIMVVGHVAAANEALVNDDIEDFELNARRLIREAVVVPPPELLDGSVEMGEVTADMIRPYFVESDPDPDQQILVDDSTWQGKLEEVNGIKAQLRDEDIAETTRAKLVKELARAEGELDAMHVMHWQDCLMLAGMIVQKGPGALRDFRPEPGAAMASVDLPTRNR